MQSNSQSGPDNERLFELLAGADANYRELLVSMIAAQATPEMLLRAIESWQCLQSSIAEGKNRLRGRTVGAAAIGTIHPSLVENIIRRNHQEELERQAKEEYVAQYGCEAGLSENSPYFYH